MLPADLQQLAPRFPAAGPRAFKQLLKVRALQVRRQRVHDRKPRGESQDHEEMGKASKHSTIACEYGGIVSLRQAISGRCGQIEKSAASLSRSARFGA